MTRGESKAVNRANRSNGTSDRQGSKIQLRWETATIFAGLDLKRACTFRNMRNSLSRSLALSLSLREWVAFSTGARFPS